MFVSQRLVVSQQMEFDVSDLPNERAKFCSLLVRLRFGLPALFFQEYAKYLSKWTIPHKNVTLGFGGWLM